MNIRTVRPQEIPAVCALVRELAATLDETSPITEDTVRAFLEHAGCGILVCETDGRVTGMLSYSVRMNLYHARPVCTIEELGVTAEHRGAGIGGALVSELFGRMRALGCAEVSVTVMPSNREALRFYREHGLTDEAVYLEKHF